MLPARMWTTCLPASHGGQKRTSEGLELDLQIPCGKEPRSSTRATGTSTLQPQMLHSLIDCLSVGYFHCDEAP